MDKPFLALHMRELATFVAICERGSLSEAARDIGITPSGVSHALAELERHFGASLLDRSHRPSVPTVLGDIVRRHAEMLIRQARTMDTEVRLGGGALPNLRIGLIESLAVHFLPRFIHGLSKRVRGFSIATDFNSGLRRRLQERTLDLLIAANFFEDAGGLEQHEVLDEPFLLLVPRGAPSLADASEFKDYAQTVPFVRNSPNSDLGQRIERHLRRMRIEPDHAYTFDSVDSVTAMVGNGFGWAMLPPTSVARSLNHLSNTELRRFPGPEIRRTITIVARNGELGALPALIADASRSVFKEIYLPIFKEMMPHDLSEIRF
ncbi:LysR family transcriptional regulator [Boseaceae bacterium BT-24-1]|nr:LysR family transcriptional regulator [Boseaceae bacterium BT-24-1]